VPENFFEGVFDLRDLITVLDQSCAGVWEVGGDHDSTLWRVHGDESTNSCSDTASPVVDGSAESQTALGRRGVAEPCPQVLEAAVGRPGRGVSVRSPLRGAPGVEPLGHPPRRLDLDRATRRVRAAGCGGPRSLPRPAPDAGPPTLCRI
jgi:hypothetical protein